MKKRTALLVTVFFIMSSCSTPSASQTPKQNDSTVSSQELSPLLDEIIADIDDSEPQDNLSPPSEQNSLTSQIQALNLDPNQVRVVSTSEIEWSDTCLEVDQPGIECLPKITQGYWVVMEANGLQFEYHADQTGSDIQPATPGLSWTRNGGEQGYCDTLIVYLPDTAFACWCQSGEMNTATANLLDILTVDEYDKLIDLLRDFDEYTVNQSSSGESNPAMVSLTFYGQGENSPNSDHQQSFISIAQEIFSRITP